MIESTTLIKDHMRTYRLIHLAMVMGSVIYGIVAILIHETAPMKPIVTDMQILTTIKYASIPYIIIIMIAIKILRTKMLSSNSIFIKKELDKKTDEESDKPPFLANYLSQLFIIWAIIETITIGGIILFLLSGELLFPLAIIAIGVFFKIINGPSFEELNQLSTKYDSNSIQGI